MFEEYELCLDDEELLEETIKKSNRTAYGMFCDAVMNATRDSQGAGGMTF